MPDHSSLLSSCVKVWPLKNGFQRARHEPPIAVCTRAAPSGVESAPGGKPRPTSAALTLAGLKPAQPVMVSPE